MTEQRTQPTVSRFDALFRAARAESRTVFIPYITAGDPDLSATVELSATLAGAGADILEIGIPFSDPLADGPTIQRSSERALARGASLREVLGILPQIRRRARIPIVIMTYLNPVLQFGLDRFARQARSGGADGVILTDLPVEEAGAALAALDAAGLDLICLAAPTSGPRRLLKIAKASRGFVYCIARTGVTGARTKVPPELRALVADVQAASGRPVAVGFGISTPEHARLVAKYADGIVIGSAVVEIIGRFGAERERMLDEVGRFARSIVAAIRGAGAPSG